jgi:hypothetical protein
MTLELKSLKGEGLEALRVDGWTVETLAVAAVKDLVIYRGIGRVGAAKIIAEAAEALNTQGLDEAEGLAEEHYYQKAPPAKILKDWETEGLPTKTVALTSARALAALKGIEEGQAIRLISAAQDVVNKRGLYESGSIGAYSGDVPQVSAAFDVRWLSGAVMPPPMSRRIRRNFERAKEVYEAAQ